MWAYVKDNKIQEIIPIPKNIVIDDVKHPAKIFTAWSWSELNSIGIYTVESATEGDSRFEITSSPTYTFNSSGNKVTTANTKTDRPLADANAVDEDGNNITDVDGNQVINYGLKTEKKRIVKEQASGLLAPTDWYVVKASEVADYSVPSNITTFRANVRTKSNEMETAIDNASDVDALKTLYEYTNTGTEADPVFTRPLGEFPTLEN